MDFTPLWNLQGTKRMDPNHELVLDTMFAGAVVMKDEIPRVLAAFEAFDKAFPGSSLPEQSEIIRREILERDDRIGVCWNQASGIAHAWEVQIPGSGSYIPYNIREQTEHWVVE